MGVRGEGECQGIVEISGKKTVSNVMCKYKDQDGDMFFGHFKAISESDIMQGTQSFSLRKVQVSERIVGEKCIGATSSISTKIWEKEILKEKLCGQVNAIFLMRL